MKRFLPVFLFSFLAFSLSGLDIWINDEFYCSYSTEELRDYAIPDNTGREGELLLSGIIPLFDDVYRIEAFGGRNRIVLEEPDGLLKGLSLVFSRDKYYLLSDDNRLENPGRIDIWGSIQEEKVLRVIYPATDDFSRNRLELFCRYHQLQFVPIPSENPARELMNRINQKKEIPHLVIFPEDTLPSLEGRIDEKRDYYFTITTLFSRRDFTLRPMALDNILVESSHRYSWNSYDYPTFSLFTSYYTNLGMETSEALKNALVMNRSLKEMGILKVSSRPTREGADFFLAETGTFNLSDKACYPDFITPLYNYYCVSIPLGSGMSALAEEAQSFLLSSETQRIIGWEKNGIYPVLSPEKYVNPSDPCLILLNKYRGKNLRLTYTDGTVSMMDNWLTLSRLALNSALSIDDLILSASLEEGGAF